MEAPEDPGAPFDEEVRETLPAEMRKQRSQPRVAVGLLPAPNPAPEHMERRKPLLRRFRADGNEEWNLAGGLGQPARRGKPGRRVDHHPERDPLPRRPGRQEWIIG